MSGGLDAFSLGKISCSTYRLYRCRRFRFRFSVFQFAAIRRRSYQPGACFLVRELQMLVFKCLHRHILYHVLGLPPRPSQQAGE